MAFSQEDDDIMVDIDFYVTIELLENLICQAKKATKALGNTKPSRINELTFRISKLFTNKPIGSSSEEEYEYLTGAFNINRERLKLKDEYKQPDIKNVENDNTETVLMDLIGLLASKGLLNQGDVKDLMNRLVKIDKDKR